MLYLGVYLLIALVLLVQFCQKKEIKNISIILCIVVCLGLVFDFALGQDLGSYVMAFDRVSTPIADAFKYHIQRNIGFNMLLYYSKQIIHHYAFFRFVLNMIIVGLCFTIIIKYSKNILLSLLLFLGSGVFVVYFGSGIRQMLSMAVFLYAFFQFLTNKKYVQYLLMAGVALAFHEAGLIMFLLPLPFIFYNKIKENQRRFIMLGLVGSIVSFFILSIVCPWIYQMVGAESTFTHVLAYFSERSIDFLGIALRTILIGVNIGLFLLIRKESRSENDHKMLITMVLIYFVYLAFSNFSLVARIYDYVAIIELVMIPNFIAKIGHKKYQLVAMMGIIGINFFLMFMDLRTLTNSESVSKYYSFSNLPYISVFDMDTIEMIIGDGQ